MDLNLIINFVCVLIGLVTIFLGILIVKRTTGKLRCAVASLAIAVIIFIAKENLKVLNFLDIITLELVTSIANLIVILLILVAAICMRSLIKKIDRHHKK